MALRMQSRTDRWGDFEEVDLAAMCAANFKLSLGYAHAAQLMWDMAAPNHTQPIPWLTFIRVWPEGASDRDAVAYGEDNPLFEGYVENVVPGDSTRVNYTAYDPTYRASKEVVVMSTKWDEADLVADPKLPPVRTTGGVPRLVSNVKIDSDDDWSQQVADDVTLGGIASGILQFVYPWLHWLDAAPGDGSDFDRTTPYDSAEMDAIDFKPQEKLVFESESPRSALSRIERYEPRRRLIYEPGTKLWRLRDITASPIKTLRLNDGSIPFPVGSLNLTPSLEHCVSAITIYGPPSNETIEALWVDDDFTDPIYPSGTYADLSIYGPDYVIETVSGTDVISWNGWQLDEASLRRSSWNLPLDTDAWYRARLSEFAWATIKSVRAFATWDNVNWLAIRGAWYDTFNGRFTLGGTGLSKRVDSTTPYAVAGSQLAPPIAVRLVWAPYIEPIMVRIPATADTYEGTAFTVAGRAVQQHVYDESVAVGKEYGVAVTIPSRVAQFEKYGRALLDQKKDIVWTGGAMLDGLDYSFAKLDTRCNIEAGDGNGSDVTTGWEDIEAFVTDVEFDFEALTTQITFSSDHLSLVGLDPSELKNRLGIRALKQSVAQNTYRIFSPGGQNWRGDFYQVVSAIQTDTTFVYTDETTGQVQ